MDRKRAKRNFFLLKAKIYLVFLLSLFIFIFLFFLLFLSIKEYDSAQIWKFYFCLIASFVIILIDNYYSLFNFEKNISKQGYIEANKNCCPFLLKILKSITKNKTKIYLSRSEEINAYCLPRNLSLKPSVILVNNGLIKISNHEELKAIIAHEVAHIKRNILKEIVLKTFALFPFIMYVLIAIDPRFKFNKNLIKIIIIFLPTFFVISLFLKNYFLKQGEFLADIKSVLKTGKTGHLISALKKSNIEKQNQENKFLGNEHPSIKERIRRLEKLKKI